MAISVAVFRSDFPEFANSSSYPDSQVGLWLGYAEKLVDESRWGDLYPLGVELLAAHNLVSFFRDFASSSGAGVPGSTVSAVSSKSVDSVSVSYDTQAVIVEGAGDLNSTMYGIRYARLAKLFGAGGVQL